MKAGIKFISVIILSLFMGNLSAGTGSGRSESTEDSGRNCKVAG